MKFEKLLKRRLPEVERSLTCRFGKPFQVREVNRRLDGPERLDLLSVQELEGHNLMLIREEELRPKLGGDLYQKLEERVFARIQVDDFNNKPEDRNGSRKSKLG